MAEIFSGLEHNGWDGGRNRKAFKVGLDVVWCKTGFLDLQEEQRWIEGFGADRELEILGMQSSEDENGLYGGVLGAVEKVNQLQHRALQPLCLWRVGLYHIFLAFRNRVTLSQDSYRKKKKFLVL